MYNDNRDIPVKVIEKVKYYPHIMTTVCCFIKYYPPPLKVVDIGARDGYSTEILKKAGYDVIGTELINDFVKHAKKKNRNVIFDDILETNLPENAFDAVYSRHCVEHCRDTQLFLSSCEKILKSDGIVFLTFPLETKKKFRTRKYPGKNHMVYFENKESFRAVVEKSHIKEEIFTKSRIHGIKPDGKEVLFIGKKWTTHI